MAVTVDCRVLFTDVTDDEHETRSIRAELQKLLVVEETEHAVGWNAALHEAIKVAKQLELDRQQRSARATAQRRRQGKRVGGDIPYGFELAPDGETLRECAAEQKVIATARRLRKSYSLREVARRLKAQGLHPREGGEFFAAQIKRMTDEVSIDG